MDRDTAEPRVTDFPGSRAREWVEYHGRTAAPSTYVYDFVWDRTAPAEGPFCTDVDGNVLLDFTSHVGAAPLGYNNPEIVDRLRGFEPIDPLKIAGQDFYVAGGPSPGDTDVPGPAELMDRLVAETDHYGLDTVFLSNSGAEAVENAIKISYDASGGGKYAITFRGAFHGRTLGTLSLNRSKEIYRRSFPEIPGVHDAPYCDDRNCTPERCSCGFFHAGPGGGEHAAAGSANDPEPGATAVDASEDPAAVTSSLRERLHPERGHVNADEVAYLIIEPIQGEGGYRIPSDAFADEIAALAEEHDLTLIVDEIQSGMGRTGEMWAADHYAIEPDVICAAKALRVGATIANRGTFPAEESRLSSTWGAGDVLASAQGALTLDAVRELGLLENATVRGRAFVETVRDADPETVVDVRGKGLMLAVEFDTRDRRDAVQTAALRRGLLTLGCGHRTLRVLPPLDVTAREIELGAGLLLDAIDDAS